MSTSEVSQTNPQTPQQVYQPYQQTSGTYVPQQPGFLMPTYMEMPMQKVVYSNPPTPQGTPGPMANGQQTPRAFSCPTTPTQGPVSTGMPMPGQPGQYMMHPGQPQQFGMPPMIMMPNMAAPAGGPGSACSTPQAQLMTPSSMFFQPVMHQSMTPNPINHMTVDQTAKWIGDLGEMRNWEEANTYKEAFERNGITGPSLRLLTMDMLKTDLGIEKHGHRLEILMAIQQLFSYLMPNTPSMLASPMHAMSPMVPSPAFFDPSAKRHSFSADPSVVAWGRAKEQSNKTTPQMTGLDMLENMSESGDSNCGQMPLMDTESVSGFLSANEDRDPLTPPGFEKFNDTCSVKSFKSTVSTRSTRSCPPARRGNTGFGRTRPESESPRRSRTPVPMIPQKNSGLGMPGMMSRKSHGVQPPNMRKKKSYAHMAADFRGRPLNNGNKSQGDAPNPKPHKKMMPRPKNPMEYKVLQDLRLRTGRSMQSDAIGQVRGGTTVLVNTVRGRRARIVKRTATGTENLGWVSLRTEDGQALLVQCQEQWNN